MICPKCGDVVFEGAVFCVRCGAMLAGTRVKEPDKLPSEPSNPWLKVAAGLFVVAAAIVVLASLSLGRSGGPSIRYVPDVLRMTRADAEAKLAKAGFECVIEEERLSNTTDAGAVISQSPGPGMPTSSKQVAIVLSLGPEVREPAAVRQPRATAVSAVRPSTSAPRSADAAAKSERREQRRQVATSSGKPKRAVAASSPATPKVSRAPAYGYVSIEAQPDDWDVWVYVDGGPARGKCPVTLRLSAGEHSLVLWEPNQQKKLDIPVKVEAGRTLSVCKDLSA